MTRVLVTDGEQRAALAVVRSLGRAGYDVYSCAARAGSISAASRHCRGSGITADPLKAPELYATTIREWCRRWGIDVLLPITEASITALLPEMEEFHGVRIPLPSCASFDAISNKAGLMRVAGRYGLNVPRQTEVGSRAELADLDVSKLEFPLVIKPARSVVGDSSGRRSVVVRYAGSAAELHEHVRDLSDAAYPLLLQQRIVGRGLGIMVLLWEGSVRAVFAHRRLREKPPSGGVSVYSESTAADPALVDRVIALLRAHGWSGAAMAEFKVDASTGQAYLMEINGRFWGSLQLAIDSGVDFPRLLLECISSDAPARPAGYRAGVRLRWWWGDVDQLLLRMIKRRHTLNLPDSVPGRFQAVREFGRLWRSGDRSEVFRWCDPRPGVVETVNWLRRR